MPFGSKFKFHSDVFLKKHHLKNFYRSTEIFLLIERHIFLQVLKTQLTFVCNFYCLTSNPLCLTKFAAKNIDFLSQLFEGASLKSWNEYKIEYNLTNETYFQWLQLKHAIPHKWKTIIKQNPGNVSDLLIHDHHLIKGARILTLEKLSSKEL